MIADENAADEDEVFVIVTCGKASLDGDMEVELSYKGDRALISYLLTSAQKILDEM